MRMDAITTAQPTPPHVLAAAGAGAVASAISAMQAAVPLVQQLEHLSFEEFDRVELQARQHTKYASTSLHTAVDLFRQVFSDQTAFADTLLAHANYLSSATRILAKHDTLPNLAKYSAALADAYTAQAMLSAMAAPPQPWYPQQPNPPYAPAV